MLGLKESGFIVSLGVTLLLIGLIAYYVRQRTAELESKFDQMFKLVQMLNNQTSKHQYTLGRMLGEIPPEGPPQHGNPHSSMENEGSNIEADDGVQGFMVPMQSKHELITVSDDDDADEDSDDDDDTDSDSDDDDSDDDNHPVITAESAEEQVKVIDLNNEHEHEIEEFQLNGASNTSSGTSDEDAIAETPTNSTGSDTLETPINISSLDQNADYGKMNVKVLKEIAQQKGIDIKGKKKGDLVEILSH